MFKKATVFNVSFGVCAVVAALGLSSPSALMKGAHAITWTSLERFDWFYLICCSVFIFICIYLALSQYGEIRLGKPGDKPEFKTASWLAMLFAAGMGSGLLFWGVAEPLTHFASPPPNSPEDAPARARWALVITNLHWGIHAWSIYAISGLTLAYFGFRKGTTLLASGPIMKTFKFKQKNTFGGAADVLAVLSVVFGVLGALGMGTLQMTTGLSIVAGTPEGSIAVSVSILVLLTAAFMLSAGSGLSRGIQILSNVNMATAILLMLFVLVFGPTQFILASFVTSIGDYLGNIVSLSTKLFPYENQMKWSHGWTLNYLVWWIAWAPFVGVFIARISKGRTIREFVLGVIGLPTLFSMLWFSVFGGTGLYLELFGAGGIAEAVQANVTEALFALLGTFPTGKILSAIALFLMFVFLVTSADSACFVLGMMTSKGSMNPATSKKLVWGVIMMTIVLVTLFSKGGPEALKALAITGAIPFVLIMLVHLYCLLKSLGHEFKTR